MAIWSLSILYWTNCHTDGIWHEFICSMVLYCAENFMTGLRIVFDRERAILGWKKFDCKYKLTYKLYNASNIASLNNTRFYITQVMVLSIPALSLLTETNRQFLPCLLLDQAVTPRMPQRRGETILRSHYCHLPAAVLHIWTPWSVSSGHWLCSFWPFSDHFHPRLLSAPKQVLSVIYYSLHMFSFQSGSNPHHIMVKGICLFV